MERTPERIQFLSDIITTAVEGGIGYWSQCSHYQWTEDGAVHVVVGRRNLRTDAYAVVHEATDNGDGYRDEPLMVDIETVARGIGRLVNKEVGIHATLRGSLLYANSENDAGEIDADLADCIVQAGIFNEIIYG